MTLRLHIATATMLVLLLLAGLGLGQEWTLDAALLAAAEGPAAVEAAVREGQRLLAAGLVAGGLLVLAGGLVLMARLAGPVRRLVAAADRVTGGNLLVPVPEQERADEWGAMARALEVLRARLEADVAEAARPAPPSPRAEELGRLVIRFGQEAVAPLRALRQAAATLQVGAGALQGSDTDPMRQAATLAAIQASTAAAAAGQLVASVEAVNQRIGHAAEAAALAGAEIRRGGERLDRLSDEAAGAAALVGAIAALAEQARMLSFNATIEAARAGESGQALALLAAEAKALAAGGADAAAVAAARVSSLQQAAMAARGSMQDIVLVVAGLDETTAGIATAVGEQGAAVRAMADGLCGTAATAAALRRDAAVARQQATGQEHATRAVQEAARAVGDQAQALSLGLERLVGRVRVA